MDKVVTESELVARSQYPRITPAQLEEQIANKKFVYTDLHVACILTLKNGFTVMGESGCAVPGNWKKDIGERLAYGNAFNQLWPLLGYELKQKVALASELGQAKTIGTEAKVYVGTKAIWARPMTRLAYNLYRGWTMPENENGDDEGYLVEYPGGHVSWSPQDVFEKAYEQIDIKGEGSVGGPTWRDRVEIEKADLVERHLKLLSFLGSDQLEALPQEQQDLLYEQESLMLSMVRVLEDRLK